jgi:hypothetical protein
VCGQYEDISRREELVDITATAQEHDAIAKAQPADQFLQFSPISAVSDYQQSRIAKAGEDFSKGTKQRPVVFMPVECRHREEDQLVLVNAQCLPLGLGAKVMTKLQSLEIDAIKDYLWSNPPAGKGLDGGRRVM